MDDLDRAQEHMEKEAPGVIARSRKPVGPQPNGRCHYCDEIVGDDARWCDALCLKAWERETAGRQRAGGARTQTYHLSTPIST